MRLSSKKKRGSPSSVVRLPRVEKIQVMPTKLPLHGPPPSCASVSRNCTSSPGVGDGVIAVGGVEVADVVRRIVVGDGAHFVLRRRRSGASPRFCSSMRALRKNGIGQ